MSTRVLVERGLQRGPGRVVGHDGDIDPSTYAPKPVSVALIGHHRWIVAYFTDADQQWPADGGGDR
jgi:hypothetical protein